MSFAIGPDTLATIASRAGPTMSDSMSASGSPGWKNRSEHSSVCSVSSKNSPASHECGTCGVDKKRRRWRPIASVSSSARALADDETLAIGRHRLRFLSTPHVPHSWDAGVFFDETEQTLLCSDLFFHPGDPEALIESDIVGPAREAVVASLSGPMAKDMPYTSYTESTLRRLAALKPRTLATMHGSAFRGDGERAMLDLAA